VCTMEGGLVSFGAVTGAGEGERTAGAGDEDWTKGIGTVVLTGGMMTTLGEGLVVLLTFAGGGIIGRILFVAVEGKVKTVMLKTIKEGLGPFDIPTRTGLLRSSVTLYVVVTVVFVMVSFVITVLFTVTTVVFTFVMFVVMVVFIRVVFDPCIVVFTIVWFVVIMVVFDVVMFVAPDEFEAVVVFTVMMASGVGFADSEEDAGDPEEEAGTASVMLVIMVVFVVVTVEVEFTVVMVEVEFLVVDGGVAVVFTVEELVVVMVVLTIVAFVVITVVLTVVAFVLTTFE